MKAILVSDACANGDHGCILSECGCACHSGVKVVSPSNAIINIHLRADVIRGDSSVGPRVRVRIFNDGECVRDGVVEGVVRMGLKREMLLELLDWWHSGW